MVAKITKQIVKDLPGDMIVIALGVLAANVVMKFF